MRLGLIGLCCMVLGGCVERTLTVTSDPEGALVYLNNQELGRTPVTREFTWYGNYDVQLRKEGYETLKKQKYVVAPIWQWVPIDLLADVVPLRLRDQRTIAFRMKPASTQPADTAVMLDRAAELRERLESSRSTRTPGTQPLTAPAAEQ